MEIEKASCVELARVVKNDINKIKPEEEKEEEPEALHTGAGKPSRKRRKAKPGRMHTQAEKGSEKAFSAFRKTSEVKVVEMMGTTMVNIPSNVYTKDELIEAIKASIRRSAMLEGVSVEIYENNK